MLKTIIKFTYERKGKNTWEQDSLSPTETLNTKSTDCKG